MADQANKDPIMFDCVDVFKVAGRGIVFCGYTDREFENCEACDRYYTGRRILIRFLDEGTRVVSQFEIVCGGVDQHRPGYPLAPGWGVGLLAGRPEAEDRIIAKVRPT